MIVSMRVVPSLRTAVFFLLLFLASASELFSLQQVDLRILLRDESQLSELARLISIDRVEGLSISGCTLDSELPRLRAAGFNFEILPRTKAEDLLMCPEGWESSLEPSWNCYPSYSQYLGMMQRLADQNPEKCRLLNLGVSTNEVNPHQLLALEITDNPEEEEAEPEIFLSSTMHGDELGGSVLLLRLAWILTVNPDGDPELEGLRSEAEIWINPLANPDGTYFGGDDTVAGAIRYLLTPSGRISAVDPNRNFPDFVQGPYPWKQPWAAETQAMIAFAGTRSIVLSANLHAGAEVVNYPWDTTCGRHPDDRWFDLISTQWALDAQENGPAGYMDDCFTSRCTGAVCTTPGVTKGADWYSVAGGRQDYMTFFAHGRELTVEISHDKLLPSSQLGQLWNGQHQALLNFIESGRQGIHGVIHDSSGMPLAARIEIPGHDTTASVIFTDPDRGDFHRLLLPGSYSLRISSTGMQEVEISGIEVPDGPPYPLLDIVMAEGIAFQTFQTPAMN